MVCYAPVKAYYSRTILSVDGKKIIRFGESNRETDENIELPCGQCEGCRIAKKRDWAIRCMCEAKFYEKNSYLTLTYAEDPISLTRGTNSDFTLFMKRLRQFVDRYYYDKSEKAYCKRERTLSEEGKIQKIRYFQCGEYGAEKDRPHHHCILFNFNPDDKVFYRRSSGHPQYISPKLCEIWQKGLVFIGNVCMQTAAYVAGYIQKKVTGEKANAHYKRVDSTGRTVRIIPEYVTMSRRPGIGKKFFDKFKTDLYPKDYFTLGDGKKLSPPKYFDRNLERINPILLEILKEQRKGKVNVEDNTLKRRCERHWIRKYETKKYSERKKL